jgi:signal transduction histidine kinase
VYRTFNTLVGRLAILQLAIHLVLPPILLYRLETVVRTSASRTFTQHAHAYARSLVNELELGDVLQSPSRTVVFLDAIVQGGGCSYAAIDFRGRLTGSSLTETPTWVRQRGNDRDFPAAGDRVYALSEGVRMRDGSAGMLYLGFDPTPTLAQIRSARSQILVALIVYALASIAAAVAFARLVSKPLTELQIASRGVARGDPAQRLGTDSTMIEIVELARDLETMRGELVGTAAELRTQMRQREIAQAERAALESHLRHEQRLATIGTFAGGLAHEFNNILLPMLLYAEEALEALEPANRARGDVERVLAAAIRASEVVSKVLAFSRPLGKRQPQPFSPAAVLRETLELSRAVVPPNIDVDVDIGRQEARVLGDETELGQVILNLFSNAIHAMRESGGVLFVRLADREGGDAESGAAVPASVELRVKDTGVGMTAAVRERIFEPFFTTRDVGDGTGLGLSVVHGIILGMGGAIRVISEPGSGAEFVIVLPALSTVVT